MLHTRIAVIFTSRLRGVKTCSLCNRGFRTCGGPSKPSLLHPRWGFKDMPYEGKIIPDDRVICIEREIFHH
jgi:hypothetical protein